MARGCCANSLISVGPSCSTGLGKGRNCADHTPLSVNGLFGRVYRTVLLLLDVAPPEILDNYEAMVRSQSFLYDDAWFVLMCGCVPSGCAREPSWITQPSWPLSACRVTTPQSHCSRWPLRTKSGGMRTNAGPPSFTLLASSRRLCRGRWHCTACSRPWGQGPRNAHAVHASIPGSPKIPLDQPTPAKEEKSATSSIPGRFSVKHVRLPWPPCVQGVCFSPGSGTRPPPPPSIGKEKVGLAAWAEGAVTYPFPSPCWSVWSCGVDAGNAEGQVRVDCRLQWSSDTRVCVLPRPTGLAVVREVSAASRQPRRLPAVTAGRLRPLPSH